MKKIKGFGDDSLVVHIGDLFRYNNVPDWSVSLWCRPIQEKKYTRLANLPLLCRGKLLNSTKPQSRRVDRVITFKPGYQISATTLSVFPDLTQHTTKKRKSLLKQWHNNNFSHEPPLCQTLTDSVKY